MPGPQAACRLLCAAGTKALPDVEQLTCTVTGEATGIHFLQLFCNTSWSKLQATPEHVSIILAGSQSCDCHSVTVSSALQSTVQELTKQFLLGVVGIDTAVEWPLLHSKSLKSLNFVSLHPSAG